MPQRSPQRWSVGLARRALSLDTGPGWLSACASCLERRRRLAGSWLSIKIGNLEFVRHECSRPIYHSFFHPIARMGLATLPNGRAQQPPPTIMINLAYSVICMSVCIQMTRILVRALRKSRVHG